MGVRAEIKQYTRAQFAAMSKAQVDKHVADVIRAAARAKAKGETEHLSYLYKALPGDRKTPEMKKRILPDASSVFKKT